MASTFARNLRATPTDAEMQLWLRLRRKQLYGLRCRRQHPMGIYVVDFFCADAKLIIEVDGGQHADDSDRRTAWLEARGYRVIRFWNNEVLTNIDGVLLAIAEAAHTAPPPVGADASPTSPSWEKALQISPDTP
jgi:very-short-patch-repair endonuclease